MPPPMCRFFNSARGCRKGEACNFQHVLVKENDPMRLPSQGGLADAAPCWNFAEAGRCPYGVRCWYSHKPPRQPKVKLQGKAAGQAPFAEQVDPSPTAAEPPSPEQQRADQVKEEGNMLYRAGEYQEAISRYTSAIEIYDAEPTYYANRAAAYMSQQKFPLALADCEKVQTLQASKPDIKTLLRYARCQLALGATSSAIGTLQAVRKAQPDITKVAKYNSFKEKADSMQTLSREVGNARRDQRWEGGADLLTRLLGTLECRYEDTTPHLIVWDIEFRIATQRFQSALETLNTLVEKEEKNVEWLRFMARALFLLNRPASAVTTLKKALQMKNDDGALLGLLLRVQGCDISKESGNQAFRRGEWTVAAGKYTAALQDIGCSSADGGGGIIRAVLLSNRAAAYAKIGAGKLSAALDDLAESLRLHPQNWKACRGRARVWVMKQEYKKAVKDFKSAIVILREETGATAAARRELEEELHKAQIELKGGNKPNHYDILMRRRALYLDEANISPTELERICTIVDIKKAYRRESLIHHPDKGGNEETFKMISKARTTLSDPVQRRAYNEELDRMQHCEDTSDDDDQRHAEDEGDDDCDPWHAEDEGDDDYYDYDSDEELADSFFTHPHEESYKRNPFSNW